MKKLETDKLKEEIYHNNLMHIRNFEALNPSFFVNYPAYGSPRKIDGYIQYHAKNGLKVLYLYSDFIVDGATMVQELKEKNVKFKTKKYYSSGIENLLQNPDYPFHN